MRAYKAIYDNALLFKARNMRYLKIRHKRLVERRRNTPTRMARL